MSKPSVDGGFWRSCAYALPLTALGWAALALEPATFVWLALAYLATIAAWRVRRWVVDARRSSG